MVAVVRLGYGFCRLAKKVSRKIFRISHQWETPRTVTADEKSQAVSDGELNMSARGCGGSSISLPGTPGGEARRANSVLRWAVSLEKLLEDPCGVGYFTAFLKSEVSEENILFWKACEKFRQIPATSLDEMKAAALSIYKTYLSESAPYSVNIDDTAKTEKSDLERPTPDMFKKAQTQIFNLMKMDSYRRFVRSPLYQRCTLASVEGKVLPQLSAESLCSNRSPILSDKKIEKSDSDGKNAPDRRQKRGSWGDESSWEAWKESHKFLKSLSSVELGSCDRQRENGQFGPGAPEQGDGAGNRLGMEGGYCCVYLPDGSASLAPTPNGVPIREMLTGLCEKRGFPLKDVLIYLHGKEKQPLSLDQDCSVVRDEQVLLELMVTFVLENAFTGKTRGIKAKSSKTLQDALSAVLQTNHLKPQDVQVTLVGSDKPVNLSSTVFHLANKRIQLDKAKGRTTSKISKSHGIVAPTQAEAATACGTEAPSHTQEDKAKTQPKPSKNPDMDGLLDMLSRAQCYRNDDQRGLLTKEQLEVPHFLQLPPSQTASAGPDEAGTATSCAAEPRDSSSSTAESVSRELRETTL